MIFLQFLVFPPPPDERPDDLVDAKYVAARFSCSVSSVQKGKCGTGAIPRVSDDPLRFQRKAVHDALAKLTQPAETPAARGARKYEKQLLRRRKKQPPAVTTTAEL